ncbi:metal-dependent transcriptional regulator [Pseudonocardia broussonetiae]|uniref:Manganese transport regulator n=1 Tax=Pseudonocardia broussonetiae TaxID=2736640 RepID=A0A6M6JB84_9PSEU|nr:metal-dependent transcriptional regulator [Pseudonocardia broussonetiae]QJY45208.1 metal-dependent transcriptional regulator [Pseudonocardia broussonetiae]
MIGDRVPECCTLAHTSAVEDTLRTVFVRSGRGEPVSTSALADELGVSAPTVSIMLKRLTAAGLLRRTDGHLAALTDHGTAHARDVVRRHRLLEAFLAQELGVPWDEVHAEADALEHAVSDRLVDRIDSHLGHPGRDPHGDPIPRAGDRQEEEWGLRLDAAPAGSTFDVERVYDRDSAALRYLSGLGIHPGVRLDVTARQPFGGPLWVRVGAADHALGEPLTHLVHGRVVA